MTLTVHRSFSDEILSESTTSIGATPVAVTAVAPCSGVIQRAYAAAGGTTTGTIAVAITVNGGSDITAGALTIVAGTGARNNPVLELAKLGTSLTTVNEGDLITFTPSGGGGASIPGAFAVAIRAV